MNKLLYRLIGFILFIVPYIAISQGTVPLKIEEFGGGVLPENSKIIVLTQNGSKRKSIKDNQIPSLSDFHIYRNDILNQKSKTTAQYPKTQLSNGNIYFVYVLTPDNSIYYSSDGEGVAEFKQVITGLIYVKLLSKSEYKWNEIYAAFNDKTHFQIFYKNNKAYLPTDTKLAILTIEKDAKQNYNFPASKIFSSDYIVGNGNTSKEYQKSAVANLRYFVYAYTNGEIYFTSDSKGKPFYDMIVSGKMYLSELNEQYDKNELLKIYFKDLDSLSNTQNSTKLADNQDYINVPSDNEDYDVVSANEKIDIPQGAKYFQWIIIAILTVVTFFISRKYTNPKQLVDFIFIGFLSTLIISTYSNSYPLIFSIAGFFLGIYLALIKEGTVANKFFVVYTYAMGGFAYSFFFQAIIDDIVLAGRTLDFLSPLLYIPLIAIAASILVHIFCVSMLVLGKDNYLTRVLTYFSVFFIPVLLIEEIKILYIQVALVHYIFIITLVALIVNFSNHNKYSNSYGYLGMLPAFVSTLLNYLIFPAIFGGILNFFFEKKFKEAGRLNNDQKKTSRILAGGTLIFHLLYFLISGLLVSLIMALTDNMVMSFALSISLLGIIPIGSLALSIFKNESEYS